MKVYFVGSISGKQKYLNNYKSIIHYLRAFGHEVTEFTIDPTEEYVKNLNNDQKIEYYSKVLKCIDASDVVVAEVSNQSIGVGHEISVAIGKQKPTIVLHEENYSPHILEGMKSEKLILVKYNFGDLEEQLKYALEMADDLQITRFTMLIPSEMISFLDHVGEKTGISKSEFIRSLIKREMGK